MCEPLLLNSMEFVYPLKVLKEKEAKCIKIVSIVMPKDLCKSPKVLKTKLMKKFQKSKNSKISFMWWLSVQNYLHKIGKV